MKKQWRRLISSIVCFALFVSMHANGIVVAVDQTETSATATHNPHIADTEDTSGYTEKYSGTVGTLTWKIYTNGLLEISGTGSIPTYSESSTAPWYSYASSITRILVRSTVTNIGAFAFYGCDNVTEVTLPFVGYSRTATNLQGTFGYIFGYIVLGGYDGYTTQYSNYKERLVFDNCIYSGTDNQMVEFYQTDYAYDSYNNKYSSAYRVKSTQSKTFVNYYANNNTTTTHIPSEAWYSCYDKYASSGYVIGTYWLNTYYFNIPTSLKTVTITDATQITNGAFNNCRNITNIYLNDGITSIGDYAFENAVVLKNFAIPQTVETLGEYAFYGDVALEEVHIPDSVTVVPDYAFYGCTGITKLELGKNLQTIDFSAFYNNTALTSLVIPEKVTTINACAFENCTSLEQIRIPDSVTILGSGAFAGCESAASLSIGSGVKTIPVEAFQNCAALTSVVVPNTVQTIGDSAFAGCTGLKEITLPFVGNSRTATNLQGTFGYIFGYTVLGGYDGYTSTYSSTYGGYRLEFDNCIYSGTDNQRVEYYQTGYGYNNYNNYYSSAYRVQSTQSTTFVNYYANNNTTTTHIPSEAWYSCYDRYASSSYVTGTYWLRTYYFDIPTSLKTVTITDATQITNGAFNNCRNLTSITINRDVTSVDPYAFCNVPWYEGLTDEFAAVGDGVLIKYNGTAGDITIPTDVKHIGGGVFRNNTDISTVTLHDALASIGKEAFYGCYNLDAITIPRNVTKIGTNAIPTYCTIHVYHNTAGYDYRSTNRVILNNSYTTGSDTYYYIVNDDGCAEIIGCSTTSTELTVPTEIDGYPVNKIGDYGFSGCTTLNSITIPSNIVSIGKYAFSGCKGLVNATIPTTVKSVGDYAFYNCTGLQNVTISEGVERIGEGAFYYCTSLAEAVVPDSVVKLGAYAFYGCTAMTNATIGSAVDGIGEYAFYGCTKLELIVAGYSVQSVGDYAFYNCTSLTRIALPATVTSIGDYAFCNNTALTRVTLRKNLLTIGEGAFQNCGVLATISIPTSVTQIGKAAFENCASITTITLPVGVTVIHDLVFSGCEKLATVKLNGDVTSIGVSAFYNCAFASITLPETLAEIQASAFRSCVNLTDITIPDATKTIGDSAFLDCSALNTVSLSDDVTTMGEGVFFHNDDLTVQVRYLTGTIAPGLLEKQGVCHVILDENTTAIGDRAFALCYSLQDITYGAEAAVAGEYKFSEKLVTIGDEAFVDNDLLVNLIIPDTIQIVGWDSVYNPIATAYRCTDVTVTIYYVEGTIAPWLLDQQNYAHIVVEDHIHTIGSRAFSDGKELSTISLPDTISTLGGQRIFDSPDEEVTLTIRGVDGTIDSSLYDGKISGITHLVIDENVDTVGAYAFANASTLKTVTVADSDLIDEYAFYKSTKLTDVTIHKAGTIGEYAFYQDTGLDNVTIGTVGTIGEYAFYQDTGLDNVTIGTVGTIGAYAFAECGGVFTVGIGTAGTIGDHAFTDSGIYSLTADEVKTISDYAFYNCIYLRNIKIADGLEHIGEHAFEECKKLQATVLPDTVRNIGAYAFYNCNSMTAINIPDGVPAINEYTFFGCASLAAMNLPDSVLTIGDYAFYGCVLIADMTLGGQTETIGSYAFYNCNKMPSLVIPETVVSIGDYAFRSCSSIQALYVPDSVTDLGDCVFYGCTDLEQVEFGTGITTVGDRVFYGCMYLDKVVFNAPVTEIHDMAFYGADYATLCAFEDEYVETYANDYGLLYYDLNNEFEMTLTAPTKVSYIEFEELDLTGLVVDVTYTNGVDRTILTGYTVSGYDPTQLGTQTITVTYKDHTATFDVEVVAKEISYITLTGAPTEAIVGEQPDLSNLVVTVVFTDYSKLEITEGYTLIDFDPETLGTQYSKIEYRGTTTYMILTVKDYVRGDINGDGLVTMKDVTRLVNYLNDSSVEIVDKALDINGDGVVSIKDVTRLTEYLKDNTLQIF